MRFHGAPAALREHALPALAAAAAPLLDDGRLWRLQLDTYEREVERYGGAAGIELAERLFHADSEAVVALLDLLEGDEGADARWRLALCGIDRLLGDLRLDAGDGGAAAKLAVLTRLRRSFWREHKGDKALRVRLDRKLRGERRALEALLFGDRAGGPAAGGAAAAYAPALAVLDRRSAALAPIAAELAAREAAGRLSVPRAALAASLVHMHANRLLRSAARAHEMVLYDFLGELIESRAARCGVKRPS